MLVGLLGYVNCLLVCCVDFCSAASTFASWLEVFFVVECSVVLIYDCWPAVSISY